MAYEKPRRACGPRRSRVRLWGECRALLDIFRRCHDDSAVERCFSDDRDATHLNDRAQHRTRYHRHGGLAAARRTSDNDFRCSTRAHDHDASAAGR